MQSSSVSTSPEVLGLSADSPIGFSSPALPY
jgi:hypothetical protein